MSYGKVVLVKYFDGQFLTTALYTLEQSYFINSATYLNAALFTSGAAAGLTVSLQGDTAISIAPGLAIDGEGREIVWPDGQGAIPLPTDLTGSVPVSIQYARQSPADDPNTYTELPVIHFGPAPDPNLVLATLDVEGGKIVSVRGAPVPVTLKLQPVAPPAPSLPGNPLVGSAEVAAGTKGAVELDVLFAADGRAVFGGPPLVHVTVQADRGLVIAATVSAVTGQGFTVTLARVWPREQSDGWGSGKIQVIWSASPHEQ
jgi:hypothetical protein